jgi:hypothetical protein
MTLKEHEMETVESGSLTAMCRAGAIAAFLSVACLVADICIGSILGGDLSKLPQTAQGRFLQLAANPWLGLYNLDLLNAFNAVIMILAFFAVVGVHRGLNDQWARLGFVVYLIGTAVFLAGNASLPMLDLSTRYTSATESQKRLLEIAGESLLARGAHGSVGGFVGFFLSSVAAVLLAVGMLKGGVFGRPTAYFGMIGGSLLSIYLVVVTFIPASKSSAILLALPGGVLTLAWTAMTALRLTQWRTACGATDRTSPRG